MYVCMYTHPLSTKLPIVFFFKIGHYPKLVFHFELKRNILYFILETYVPSSLLVVLSWVSFWISQSSVPARICIGEKQTIHLHPHWHVVFVAWELLQPFSFLYHLVYMRSLEPFGRSPCYSSCSIQHHFFQNWRRDLGRMLPHGSGLLILYSYCAM